MKCLFTYQWVKLPRAHLPAGKGVMGFYLKLASQAAFRSGKARYCNYVNSVPAGSWVGGMVGLKSILGVKTRAEALSVMKQLQTLGYISYSLDTKTKKLTYGISDWVMECSGKPCLDGAIYATEGYGFLCMPRSITDRLADVGYTFGDTDAWLDLWCHTVWGDRYNAFSRLAPTVQIERGKAILTLDTLGKRWGWEKTKVWRFFQKYAEAFTLQKLHGAYGCLVFNTLYPTAFGAMDAPSLDATKRILDEIRILGQNAYFLGVDHARINGMTLWYSSRVNLGNLNDRCPSQFHPVDGRVAPLRPYNTRAYLSLSTQKHTNCTPYRDDCRVCNTAMNRPSRGPRIEARSITLQQGGHPYENYRRTNTAGTGRVCPTGGRDLHAIHRLCETADQAWPCARYRHSGRECPKSQPNQETEHVP